MRKEGQYTAGQRWCGTKTNLPNISSDPSIACWLFIDPTGLFLMNHHSNRSWFLQTMAQTSDAPLMLEIERAEGNWMIAPDGKRYLDLISGISVSSLGHGNKAVIDAIQQQLQKHMHLMVYGEVVQQPQMQLAEALRKVLPEHLNNFYF